MNEDRMYIQKGMPILQKMLIFHKETNIFGGMMTHFWMYILSAFHWPALYPHSLPYLLCLLI